MQFLHVTLPTLEENLALDEALLLDAEETAKETLRIWEWPTRAVVLGAAGRISEDVNETACVADNVPLARRSSGGGTVLLGSGCLLFSLILEYRRAAELTEILPSYRFVLGRIREAIGDVQPDLELAGTSDLVFDGRKVSGNSQQRKRRHLLHHGTLLYSFDAERVEHYLQLPQRQPEYRDRRTHREFLANLSVNQNTLIHRLRECWEARDERLIWPEERVRRLVAEKYGLPEWIRRR